jgi:hypothetical protein
VRIGNGVLGALAIDRNGDVTNPRITIFRLTRGRRSPTGLGDQVGTAIDRVIAVPSELVPARRVSAPGWSSAPPRPTVAVAVAVSSALLMPSIPAIGYSEGMISQSPR